VFKKYALKRSPGTALFCIFEGNDLRDIASYLNWQRGGDYYHFNLTSKNVIQRSFIALKDTGIYLAKRFSRKWDPRTAEVALPGLSFKTIFAYKPEKRSMDELTKSPEIKKLREILSKFKEVSEENGVIPAVVFIPSPTHIFLPYATPPDKYKEDLENMSNTGKAVEQTAKDVGIKWLDLTPAFERETKQGRLLFYTTDTHWNSDGRELAAKELSRFISEDL
jgi:hypothetical protein